MGILQSIDNLIWDRSKGSLLTSLFLCINTHMKDKKAAKKIIKIAKCCPEYYSEAEVTYAKIIKKRIKHLEKDSK